MTSEPLYRKAVFGKNKGRSFNAELYYIFFRTGTASACSCFLPRVLGVSPNKCTLHFVKNVGQSAYLAKRRRKSIREKREKERVLREKRKDFEKGLKEPRERMREEKGKYEKNDKRLGNGESF